MELYEYYDGYEHLWEEDESNRVRVQYFVLGEVPPNMVGICYTNEDSYMEIIGNATHRKAWKIGHITLEQAQGYLHQSYNKVYGPTIEEYRNKHKELLSDTTQSRQIPYGHSISSSHSYWRVSFHCAHNENYNVKFAEQIAERIRLYELREAFMERKMTNV